jgi:hypothetical protein
MVNLKTTPPPREWGVWIVPEALEHTAHRLTHQPFPTPGTDMQTFPTGIPARDWVTYIGLSVSVLACLWPPEGQDQWTIDLNHQRFTDAQAVFGCFTRGLKHHARGYDLQPLLEWTTADAQLFFRGHGHFQLIPERAERLRNIATVLTRDWGGSFWHLLEHAQFDAEAMVLLLCDHMPGYRDEATTAQGSLVFAKLARLATALMSQRLQQPLEKLDRFPVYPDYMIPKVFRHWGIFRYDPDLAHVIDSRQSVPKDSPWEYGLRWGTIHAAEQLRLKLEARGRAIDGPALDFFLWHAGVLGPEAQAMGEHHRTITLAY